MTRLLAIGECMVEMAPLGDAGTYQMGFAGDTMNTAWYLRRLLPQTDQVDYFTAVGQDAASDQMVAFLQSSGIGTEHVARRADRTVGLYMIQLQAGERSFSYWRGQSAARTLADDADVLQTALSGVDMAYFSGITLAILSDMGRACLLDCLRAYRAGGGAVIFDPNLRPKLWASGADMMAAITQAAAVSDTVLPSFEDEATWFKDTDSAATAKRYVDAGANVVIVKNGADEILAWDNGTVTQHAPQKVAQVIDTTAAGDSFNAGFLASRIAGQDVSPSIAVGAQLAAKVVQSHGALVQITP